MSGAREPENRPPERQHDIGMNGNDDAEICFETSLGLRAAAAFVREGRGAE